MAWYKNANNLRLASGTEAVWSTDYKPAATVLILSREVVVDRATPKRQRLCDFGRARESGPYTSGGAEST